MLVLAAAIQPADLGEVAHRPRIAADSYGFLKEAHPKLRPVEPLTAGVFLAGAVQSPEDTPDTLSQASAAAAKGMTLLAHELIRRDPTTARVDESRCMGCFECLFAFRGDRVVVSDPPSPARTACRC